MMCMKFNSSLKSESVLDAGYFELHQHKVTLSSVSLLLVTGRDEDA
jgi:hypothetical protein